MKRLNVLFSVICFLFMALMTACQDDVLTPVQEEEKTEQNGFWIKEVDEQGRIIGETKYTTTKTANVSGTGTYSHNDRVNLSTTSGYTLYYRKESSSSYTSANGSTYTIDAIQSNYYVKAEKKVTITATASASPTAGGSVTCTDNNNGTWSLKATANTGYSFEKWTTTAGTIASATSSSTTLTTSSNATVTGNFKANQTTTSYSIEFTVDDACGSSTSHDAEYTVTVSGGVYNGQSFTVSRNYPQTYTLESGVKVSLSYDKSNTNMNRLFKGWYKGSSVLSTTKGSYTYTISGACTLTGKWN